MPVISTFFGIVIRMFYKEHGVGQVHAEYQGQMASFTVDGKLLAGAFRSRTALRLVEEWARPSAGVGGQLGAHDRRRDAGANPAA